MVLVDHIWSPSFSLRFQNAEPELLSLHRSSSTTFFLVALVKLFKFLPPAVTQPRTLMRAHEGPVFILFHTFHEQIRHPHRIEQIPSTLSHTYMHTLMNCIYTCTCQSCQWQQTMNSLFLQSRDFFSGPRSRRCLHATAPGKWRMLQAACCLPGRHNERCCCTLVASELVHSKFHWSNRQRLKDGGNKKIN